MLCYTGIDFTRVYMTRKDKRLVWKEYISEQPYIFDFEDLRRCYVKIFSGWSDPTNWSESECFFDDHF
jgi:hypothetical protein